MDTQAYLHSNPGSTGHWYVMVCWNLHAEMPGESKRGRGEGEALNSTTISHISFWDPTTSPITTAFQGPPPRLSAMEHSCLTWCQWLHKPVPRHSLWEALPPSHEQSLFFALGSCLIPFWTVLSAKTQVCQERTWKMCSAHSTSSLCALARL